MKSVSNVGYFSGAELLEKARKVFPELNNADLRAQALGGYLETDKGFIWYSDWRAITRIENIDVSELQK